MLRPHLAIAALVALAAGCDDAPAAPPDAGAPDAGPPDAGPPVPPTPGALLIEEIYYAGAPPAGGTDHYFSDQFVELVNTTDAPLDLSGLGVGDAFGVAGAINPGTEPDSYRESRPESVVLANLWRVPDGTVLPPGGHLVIAQDGTNHRPFSTVDHSGAAFETFVEGGDEDSPTVPNLTQILFTGGRDWLVPVFGASVVLIQPGAPLGEIAGPFGPLVEFPAESVLDAVEALMDASSGAFKRLPDSVDRGFAHVSGTYTGESLRRRRDGAGWQDTGDSGADFELATPEPGLPPPPGAVSGDPAITLGTGVGAFAPLPEGAEVELVAGLQGGWHLDVAVRGAGFGPDGVRLVYDAVTTTADPVGFSTSAELRERSVIATDEGWDRVGDRVVLDIADPSEVVDAPVILRVTATLGGVSVGDERRVTVVDRE